MKDKRFIDCALTINQEQEVCKLYQSGIRAYPLAQRFGVTYSTIMRILRAYQIPTSKKTYKYNEIFFDEIDTEAKSYFLGLLVADGYIKNGPKRYIVQLSLIDRHIVEDFHTAIQSNQPIYEVDMSKWNGNPIYMLAIGSKKMVNSLAQYGVVQGKTKRIFITDKIPAHLVNHYLRGIFDGDGSIGIYKGKPAFSLSGSERVINGYVDILMQSAHIHHRPKVAFATGRFKFSIANIEDVRRIASFLYHNATIYLTRKYALISPYIVNQSILSL